MQASPWELLTRHTRTGNTWYAPLHLSQCSSRSTCITSQHQYYTNLHIQMQTLASRWITVFSYKVFPFRPAPSAAQHFHNLHVIASCGSESSHLWIGHVASECVMSPLDVSYYLWMHHVILKHVTSECVMLPCFTLFSVTYTYTCIEKPLRFSHISTVVNS